MKALVWRRSSVPNIKKSRCLLVCFMAMEVMQESNEKNEDGGDEREW